MRLDCRTQNKKHLAGAPRRGQAVIELLFGMLLLLVFLSAVTHLTASGDKALSKQMFRTKEKMKWIDSRY